MFVKKSTTKRGKNAKSGVKKKRHLTPRALAMAQIGSQAVSAITTSAMQAAAAADEYTKLRRIMRIANTYGLNRAFIEMVNPGNVLTGRVAGMPACESLNNFAMSPTDSVTRSFLAGLKGVLEEEGEAVADYVAAISDAVDASLTSCGEQAGELLDVIEDLRDGLSNAGDGDLHDSEVITIKASARGDQLDILSDVLASFDVPNYTTDDEGRDAIREGVNEIVEKIKPFTGAIVDSGVVGLNSEGVAEEYVPATGTLAEFGYSKEATVDLLDKAASLLGTLIALCDQRAAICAQIAAIGQSAAAEIVNDDEAAASEDDNEYTPVPEDNPENTEDNETQTEFTSEDDSTAPTDDPVPDPENPDGPAPIQDPMTDPAQDEPAAEDDASIIDVHRQVVASWTTLMTTVTTTALAACTDVVAVADLLTDVVEAEPAGE